MLIPKLLDLMSARFFHFNTKDNMYVGGVMLGASYVCLVVLYSRSRNSNFWLAVPTAYVYFGLLQWYNALFGFQFAWYLVLFCLLSALLALSYLEADRLISRTGFLLLALGLATVASLSSLQGLFIWVSGLFYLICRGTRRIYGFIWALVGTVVSALYFARFDFQSTGCPSVLDFIKHPVHSAQYFFFGLGAVVPLYGVPHIRTEALYLTEGIIGILLFGLSVWILASAVISNQRDVISLEAALIVFGLMFDASLVIGRSGFGMFQASSSSYSTYNQLLLAMVYLGLISLASETRGRGRPLAWAAVALICAIVLLQVTTATYVGLAAGRTTKESRTTAAAILVNYRVAPDCLVADYTLPLPDYFRALAPIVEAHKLSAFFGPAAASYRPEAIMGKRCNTLSVPLALEPLLAHDAHTRSAWLLLSKVYQAREDLQKAFPAGSPRFAQTLLRWATTSGATIDPDAGLLRLYRANYAIMRQQLALPATR
jgi:hypothetical protein